jgi:predicted transcriptional regulator
MMQLQHDPLMRITIDLPDNLHRLVTSLATQTRRSLSQTATDLMRQGLAVQARAADAASAIQADCDTDLPVLHCSRPITSQDVKALEDES